MWPTSNVAPFVCRFYSETGQVRGTKWWVLSRSFLLCCRFDVIVYFFYWLFSCFSSRGHHSRHTRPHTHTKRNRKTFNASRPRLMRDWSLLISARDFFFFFFFDILNFRLGVQMYAGPLWLGVESFLCFPFFLNDCYDILHFQLFHADNGCASGVISIFPPRFGWCPPKERGGGTNRVNGIASTVYRSMRDGSMSANAPDATSTTNFYSRKHCSRFFQRQRRRSLIIKTCRRSGYIEQTSCNWFILEPRRSRRTSYLYFQT